MLYLLRRICELICCGMGLNGMMQRELTITFPLSNSEIKHED